MKLQTLVIQNFKSYAGTQTFEFGDKLNLIIGNNGNGKTTVLDALGWLFNTEKEDSNLGYFSKYALKELKDGESVSCAVSLTFEHKGRKTIKKEWKVVKEDGRLNFWRPTYSAHEELESGERVPVNEPNKLLNECFESTLRKFCMFKGEGELSNYFDGNASVRSRDLATLITSLSRLSEFDKYKKFAEEVSAHADKAWSSYESKDRKSKKQIQEKKQQLDKLKYKYDVLESKIARSEQEIAKCTEIIIKLEDTNEAREELRDIWEQITALQNRRADLRNQLDVKLNIKLLDDFWILKDYQPIFKELSTKLRKAKNVKQEEHDKEIEKKGEAKAKKAMANILPWYLPTEDQLQQMLNEERCEVCGREAKKGSDAYIHMLHRLDEFRKKQEAAEAEAKASEKKEPLFKYEYLEEVEKLNIEYSGYGAKTVNERIKNIPVFLQNLQKRRDELLKVEAEIAELEAKKLDLLSQNELDEDELSISKSVSDYQTCIHQRGKEEGSVKVWKQERTSLELQIANLEDEINNTSSKDPELNLYGSVRGLLKIVVRAFEEGREKNAQQCVQRIQDRATAYLRRLGSTDFMGNIRLERSIRRDSSGNVHENVNIRLLDANEEPVSHPSESQKTVAFLAVLFALSDIAKEKRDNDYPLIFDAPTSSMDRGKELAFYATISDLDKQCIITTKDFLQDDGSLDEKMINQLHCTVFRIVKSEGMVASDQSTIRTVVSQWR